MKKIFFMVLITTAVVSCKNDKNVTSNPDQTIHSSNPIVGEWESKQANSVITFSDDNTGRENSLEGKIKNTFKWKVDGSKICTTGDIVKTENCMEYVIQGSTLSVTFMGIKIDYTKK